MQQTMTYERRWLYITMWCLVLFLAAAPFQAAPTDRHKAGGNKVGRVVAPPDYWPHKGLFPNTLTNDVGSYRIHYARPHGKTPASIVISMHLDTYDGIQEGSGSFQKRTPQGNVLVKWQRAWVTLDPSQAASSEFTQIPVYTLTIDSPKTLPVQLKTQQYATMGVLLNGHPVSSGMHSYGDYDPHGPYDAVHFAYTFPGGHNVLVLETSGYRDE